MLDENGPFSVKLRNVEVMGRDTSVVSTHPCSLSGDLRSIIPSESRGEAIDDDTVRFSLKPFKVRLFSKTTEEALPFEEGRL